MLPAAKQIPIKMSDWIQSLDAFLTFNEYNILKDAGRVTHDVAIELPEKEYERFRVVQDKTFESDFDKEVKEISKKNKGLKEE